MRVIGGKLRGRVFTPPKNFRARPTTDFAKENLFNILNNRVDWDETVALDLFGGTGGISYELISRGCKKVVCVERDFKHAEFIEKTKQSLDLDNLHVIRMDVFKYLERNINRFDFIFADPPYDIPNFEDVPRLILEKDLLNKDGLFVLEHSKKYDFSSLPLFYETRAYGSVNFSFFSNSSEE